MKVTNRMIEMIVCEKRELRLVKQIRYCKVSDRPQSEVDTPRSVRAERAH